MRRIIRWCAALLRRGRVERDLAAELQFHVDQQVEENIAAGMDAATARRAALRAFGSMAHTKDECRDALWLTAFNVIEIRALFRMMWRNRASSAAAIFMVATSAAVATTTFAFADAALWRALPYRDASRLAMVVTTQSSKQPSLHRLPHPALRLAHNLNTGQAGSSVISARSPASATRGS